MTDSSTATMEHNSSEFLRSENNITDGMSFQTAGSEETKEADKTLLLKEDDIDSANSHMEVDDQTNDSKSSKKRHIAPLGDFPINGEEPPEKQTRAAEEPATDSQLVETFPTKQQNELDTEESLDNRVNQADDTPNLKPIERAVDDRLTDKKTSENELVAPVRCINILLLGESGVGKSTWINGLFLYSKFAKLENAKCTDFVPKIPIKFTMTNENYDEIPISVGSDENESQVDGQSSTQSCKNYIIKFEKCDIRVIDSPGVGDTRGLDKDKENFEKIMKYVSEIGELDGICILLKPNNARLTMMFQFCMKQLLAHVDKNRYKNIIFCFTHSRNTFFQPGDTLPALRKLLEEYQDKNLTLTPENVYCIDSEAVRFLAACVGDYKKQVIFSEEEEESFSESYEKSVSESKRLIDHISKLSSTENIKSTETDADDNIVAEPGLSIDRNASEDEDEDDFKNGTVQHLDHTKNINSEEISISTITNVGDQILDESDLKNTISNPAKLSDETLADDTYVSDNSSNPTSSATADEDESSILRPKDKSYGYTDKILSFQVALNTDEVETNNPNIDIEEIGSEETRTIDNSIIINENNTDSDEQNILRQNDNDSKEVTELQKCNDANIEKPESVVCEENETIHSNNATEKNVDDTEQTNMINDVESKICDEIAVDLGTSDNSITISLTRLNILLLGESGVGKSTWINGLVNYTKFKTLDDAENHKFEPAIPVKFTMTDQNYEEIPILIGNDQNEAQIDGQSSTQSCKLHKVMFGSFEVCMIDTPGIGDTRGLEKDKENFEHVMEYITKEVGKIGLHGICILLKPNNARLTMMFQFCMKQLLSTISKEQYKNIIFCFTHSRNTFYQPGDTLPALRRLLQEYDDNNLTLTPENVYCIDNEAVRFLAALSSSVKFDRQERESFAQSWSKSVEETSRLLTHISKLMPHPREAEETPVAPNVPEIIIPTETIVTPPPEQTSSLTNDTRPTDEEEIVLDNDKQLKEITQTVVGVVMDKHLGSENQIVKEQEISETSNESEKQEVVDKKIQIPILLSSEVESKQSQHNTEIAGPIHDKLHQTTDTTSPVQLGNTQPITPPNQREIQISRPRPKSKEPNIPTDVNTRCMRNSLDNLIMSNASEPSSDTATEFKNINVSADVHPGDIGHEFDPHASEIQPLNPDKTKVADPTSSNLPKKHINDEDAIIPVLDKYPRRSNEEEISLLQDTETPIEKKKPKKGLPKWLNCFMPCVGKQTGRKKN